MPTIHQIEIDFEALAPVPFESPKLSTPEPQCPTECAKLFDRTATKRAKDILSRELRVAITNAPAELSTSDMGLAILGEINALRERCRARWKEVKNGITAESADSILWSALGHEYEQLSLFRFGLPTIRLAERWHRKPSRWEQLLDALEAECHSRHSEHVTLQIPGAGVYRLRRCKDVLIAFAARLEKRFGRVHDGAYRIAACPKSTPTAVPDLPRTVAISDHLAALQLSTAPSSSSQGPLTRVLQEPPFAVASDGHRLTVLLSTAGMTAAQIREMGNAYPEWRNVCPDCLEFTTTGLLWKTEPHVTVDSADLFRMAILGCQGTTIRTRAVRLHQVDSLLKVSTHAVDENGNLLAFSMDGAENIGPKAAFDCDYFLDVATQARRLGIQQVGVVFGESELHPVTFRFGDLGFTLVMPLRIA